ncbi:MAG: nucleotidyl transferase AbiEii/AbiGii toxin family protein [Myxococcota bacterium]
MGGLKTAPAVLSPAQRHALALAPELLPPDAYLAGGVAVALSLAHRTSHDLDFFVPHTFDELQLAERMSVSAPGIRITGRAPSTVYLEVEDVPVSIIAYRYPMLVPPTPTGGVDVAVAAPEDLISMKFSAIASRGAARDFWDAHALMGLLSYDDLQMALTLYRRKYATEDVGHVVRSVVYFADAEAGPWPRGLESAAWDRIKADFRAWVLRLA